MISFGNDYAMDLDRLSFQELNDLQTQVAQAIASHKERAKREALSDIEERARTLGFSLSELVGAASVHRRRTAPAKYVNPDNDKQIWSGRGRQPRWIVAALKRGMRLEDLRV